MEAASIKDVVSEETPVDFPDHTEEALRCDV